jgi:hypothetical protein
MRKSLLGWFLISSGILGLSILFLVDPTIHGGPSNTAGDWKIWPPLAVAFVGTGLLYWHRKTVASRLAATFLFGFMFYSFYYFYTVFGSDVGGIIGILSSLATEGRMTAKDTYGAWPLFFFQCAGMGLIPGLDVAHVLKSIFLVQTITISLAFILLYRTAETRTPFMPIMVYFISCYAFLNWQAAPQTLGLVMLILFFALQQRIVRPKLLGIFFFIFLTFEHGFVNLWFLGILICIRLFDRRTSRGSGNAAKSNLDILLMIAIECSFLAFYARNFFESTMATLRALISPSATTGAPLPYVTNRLSQVIPFASGEDLLTAISKLIALLVIVVVLTLVIIGLYMSIRKRDVSRTEFSFITIGGAHLLIGSILPLLGWRAIQLASVGLPRFPRISARSIKMGAALVFSVLILLPNNIVRINASTTLYLDNQDFVTRAWFHDNVHIDSEKRDGLLASSVLGGLIAMESHGQLRYFGPRTILASSDDFAQTMYFVSNPTFEYELLMTDHESQLKMQNITSAITESGNLFLDTGIEKVYAIDSSTAG